MWLPGVLVAAAAALAAWGIHAVVPALPLLTIAVGIGIIVAQLPVARPALTGILSPGLSLVATRFMRLGIVLLGLKLSLVDILGLGWVAIVSTVAVVLLTFLGTWWFGRWVGLPGHQPLLIATGFSICGASAIGAMSGVVKAKDSDASVPIALVTLCGTLAIAVLPALWHPLGLTELQFGHWVGGGVHDVGQVVATAQVAGPAALAIAVVVKLTRVLMLAPIVATVSAVERRRHAAGLGVNVPGASGAGSSNPGTSSPRSSVSPDGGAGVGTGTDSGTGTGVDGLGNPVQAEAAEAARTRPPLVPLFVVGFLVAVLLRTFLPLPPTMLVAADTLQTALLAMALFALGAAVRLGSLLRTGWRALLVGLLSWALIAALALAATLLG